MPSAQDEFFAKAISTEERERARLEAERVSIEREQTAQRVREERERATERAADRKKELQAKAQQRRADERLVQSIPFHVRLADVNVHWIGWLRIFAGAAVFFGFVSWLGGIFEMFALIKDREPQPSSWAYFVAAIFAVAWFILSVGLPMGIWQLTTAVKRVVEELKKPYAPISEIEE